MSCYGIPSPDVQVYLMDKRFLDPRRPHKAAKALTPAEQEERLIPYSPLLPLAPNSFATYSRAVARLAGADPLTTCGACASGPDSCEARGRWISCVSVRLGCTARQLLWPP
jgi:ER membrane protein complex subunit 1, C-terminal